MTMLTMIAVSALALLILALCVVAGVALVGMIAGAWACLLDRRRQKRPLMTAYGRLREI